MFDTRVCSSSLARAPILVTVILVSMALPASLSGQEPWLEFGDFPWGVRLVSETIALSGGSFPNQLQVWYPAAEEGVDVPAADGGPFPVIFFEHAGGSDYTWYDYQFSRLASRGFVVVSIRHDHAPCPGDWWSCHSELYEFNLETAFEVWNVTASHYLFEKLDPARIGLAGHSHGSAFIAMQAYQPMNPAADYEISSVCLIAPCPDIPIRSYLDEYFGMPPVQVIYGSRDECSCTGTGQGIAMFEPGRRPRHHAYVLGASHWSFCEGGSVAPATIPRLEAWRASAASMAAFHSLIHFGDESALPYLRGELPLTTGAPEVRYQFQDGDALRIDDFDAGATVAKDGIAIAGIPGQTYINGFLSDTFTDFSAGVAVVNAEITDLIAGSTGCREVLFYRDGALGPCVYETALAELEAAGKVCTTFTTSQSDFGTLIPTAAWDLVIAANQNGSSSSTHPFDAPLETYVCNGGKAIVSDFRIASPTADDALQCSDSGFDGETNWSSLISVDDQLFTGTLTLANPGWGIWSMGLLADDAAVVYAENEITTLLSSYDPFVNSLGLEVTASGFETFENDGLLQPIRTLYHPSGGIEIAWTSPGAIFTETLSTGGGFDGSPWRSLAFRILQLHDDPLNPVGALQDLTVRLEDVDGDQAELTLSDAAQGALRAPAPPDPGVDWKSIFESYRFRLAQFRVVNPTLDVDRLASVSFVCDVTPTGRCFLDDVEFSDREPKFFRGDCSGDAVVNIADAIFGLAVLFSSGPAPVCEDACDTNDDGQVNIADAVNLLNYLFQAGGPLPPPLEMCGADVTPEDPVGCDASVCP
ncbi:MAG: hypothetical protein ACKVX7_08105 [Planctomycetota bacterium]